MTKQRTRRRRCPRCETLTGSTWHCGLDLTARRRRVFTVDAALAKRIHVMAYQQKGLTKDEYRLRLSAVGVDSCKQLNGRQFREFMAGLSKLPNAKSWKPRRATPSRAGQ